MARLTRRVAANTAGQRKDAAQDRKIANLTRTINTMKRTAPLRAGPAPKAKARARNGNGNTGMARTRMAPNTNPPPGMPRRVGPATRPIGSAPVEAGLMAFDAFGDAPILSKDSTGRAVKFNTIAQNSLETRPPMEGMQNDTPFNLFHFEAVDTLGFPIPSLKFPTYPENYVDFGPSMYLFIPQDTGVLGWKMTRCLGPSIWYTPTSSGGLGQDINNLYTVAVEEIRWPKLNNAIEGTQGNMPFTMRQGKQTMRIRNTSPGLQMGGVARVLRLTTGLDTKACGLWCPQEEGATFLEKNWQPQGIAFDNFCDFVRTHPKTITYSGAELSESQFINAIPINQTEYMDYQEFCPHPFGDKDDRDSYGADPCYNSDSMLHHYGPGSSAFTRVNGGVREFIAPMIVGWEFNNYSNGQNGVTLANGTVTVVAVIHTYPDKKLPEAYQVTMEDSTKTRQQIRYGYSQAYALQYPGPDISLHGLVAANHMSSVNGPLPMDYRISGPDPYKKSTKYDGDFIMNKTDVHQQQQMGVNIVQKILSDGSSPPMSAVVMMFEPMGRQVDATANKDEGTNTYELSAALQTLTRYSPSHILNSVATLPPTQPPAVITKLRDAAEKTGSFLEKVGSVASKVISVGKAVAPYIGKALKWFL